MNAIKSPVQVGSGKKPDWTRENLWHIPFPELDRKFFNFTFKWGGENAIYILLHHIFQLDVIEIKLTYKFTFKYFEIKMRSSLLYETTSMEGNHSPTVTGDKGMFWSYIKW